MMSDKKRKRGRPRVVPILSYGSEQKLRNNYTQRIIIKPKYLKDREDEDSLSRGSTPARSIDSRGSLNGGKNISSRGYNPDFDDKDSEYHYGSDFDMDEEPDRIGISSRSISEATSDIDLSDLDDLGDTLPEGSTEKPDFVPFWQLGPAGTLGIRAPTPIPVWLQDRQYPELVLPKSSDDLLIPKPFLFDAVGVYETLRHFCHLVRLSPFHFEDFCACLLIKDQSTLLIEIHISLIKALIREEELQQTHFGTLDQKDSINISLYFIDYLTWPETLRQYVYSDKNFKNISDTLNSCNYPFTSLSKRLKVLRFLCDQFLQTSVVRDFLLRDGKIRYDDHCRACHKPGDLLCCDTCSAVYHLTCVKPPITSAPSEIDDWTCIICNAEKLEGVTDCLSIMESSGMMCRQEPIGCDRHGRKFWFLVRRIFVESKDGEISYYSSAKQIDLLMSLIDKTDLEESLYVAFKEFREDIVRQMEITEKLTDNAKGNKMDLLTLETEETETKIKELEDKQQLISEVKDEVKDEPMDIKIESSVKELANPCPLPLVKSESSDDEIKLEQKVSELVDEKPRKIYDEATLDAMVKSKLLQLHHNNNTSPFRLGCDSSYRSYTNQFTTNTLALNKIQHNEERDKKRYLSHKFSLTNGSEFKWSGSTYGSKEVQVNTVRMTLLNMEQNMSLHFFHPHWPNIRKAWTLSVSASNTPRQLAKAMMKLIACVKPVVFLTVWNDSLGHIRLRRITALDREYRKKQEKREKRESDDEAKLFPFIKYPIIPKHQLWKMKGEEYRMHGLWGWQWLASHRRRQSQSMNEVGLRAGPDKVNIPVESDQPTLKVIPVSAESYNRLTTNNKHLRPNLLSPKQITEEQSLLPPEEDKEDSEQPEVVFSSNTTGIHQRMKVRFINLEDHFDDGLVPVSKSLNNRSRLLYPKIGKGSSLDSLLTRRLSLKIQEERDFANKKHSKNEDDSRNYINIDDETDVTDSDLSDDENVEKLPDSQRVSMELQGPTANLLKDIRMHKVKYETLDRVDEFLPCYSPSCRGKGKCFCYSPTCMLKEKTKQKLITSLKNYKIVSSKPPPFDEIGIFSPIRVKDLDKSPKKNRRKKENKTSIIGDTTNKSSDSSECINLTGDSSDTKIQTDEESSQCSSESELKESLKDRIFSGEDTSGKVYLRSSINSKKTKKKRTVTPPLRSFKIFYQANDKLLSSPRESLFALPPHELNTLARKGGKLLCEGFNHNAKSNLFTWPYPSSRPVFKLTWLFRTMTMPSISTAAYQLRILWACLRWEDMNEKGCLDGRKQITSDSEIIQAEVLKRKYRGRFLEKTEYLQRKVTIPLDMPKTVREFTPSQRSGLRKRRRAHSPINKQPESVEDWVEEEKLDLWEIRFFGERIEKAALMHKKQTESVATPVSSRSISPCDFKTRMEEQMKIQRASFNQKKNLESSPGVIKVAIGSALPSMSKIGNKVILGGSNIVTVGNKLQVMSAQKKIVTTKGGKIITVQTAGIGNPLMINNQNKKFAIGKNASVFPVSSLPKVQVTSGKQQVIKIQNISPGNPQRSILPRSSIATTIIRPTSNIRPTGSGQPIQFVRLASGQIQMKATNQQLIQRSDGKIQILGGKAIVGGSSQLGIKTIVGGSSQLGIKTIVGGSSQLVQSPQQTPIQITQQQLKTMSGLKGLTGGQIVKINGQQVILRTNADANKTNETKILTTTQANLSNVKAVKTSEGGYAIKAINASSPQHQQPIIVKEKPNTEGTTGVQNTLTLRVQVRMTEQGPKTIIQGLQPGGGLTKDHIMAIQHQVREMLTKCNLQINQLSPLMTITLNVMKGPDSSQEKTSPSKFFTEESKDDLKKLSPLKGKQIVSPLVSPNKVSTTDTKKEFVVTNDYIQQTIKSALNNKNELPVAVEKKLVALQKFTNEKNEDLISEKPGQGKKRKLEKDENDWDSSKTVTSKSKAKRTRTDRGKVNKKVAVVHPLTPSKSQETKRKAIKQQKLDVMLGKLQENLKKDILQKRALLEKELKIQIHKDLAVAKQHMQMMEKLKVPESPSSNSKKKLDTSTTSSTSSLKGNSKSRRKSENSTSSSQPSTPSTNAKTTPSKVNISSSSKSSKKSKGKNKKIVCICRTPFDDTKFYVGCDLCGNWFHGECVGITEALSRSMTEYVCDDCTNAKLNKDLYCFCRQPYDESQFYICCERCEDWFHGKCIGIMQSEADDIDDYICPKCDANNKWNRPCQKKMNSKDCAELKKLAKALITHKSAWPFLEPVNQSEVPDYYKVVKEPMDLKTIDAKVLKQKYDNLSKFVADVMLVFDNCRAYNPPNSSFCSCAQALELFFCQRLKQFKQKLSHK